jgi:hypothetical protein
MIGRAALFSMVATIVYTAAFYANWPQLYYYLNTGFHFAPQPEAAGHVIFWYGWLATAAAAGAVVAVAVPKKLLARLPIELGWMAPIAATVAALAYEMRWFL